MRLQKQEASRQPRRVKSGIWGTRFMATHRKTDHSRSALDLSRRRLSPMPDGAGCLTPVTSCRLIAVLLLLLFVIA